MIPSQQELYQAAAERHGKDLQKKLQQSTVAVCGLGGLGSNIAVSLTRAGIGKLILIDFDRVDITNLQRQQYKAHQVGMNKTEALANNLAEINPYLQREIHTVRITPENINRLLAEADIIVEAFDNPEVKSMLVDGVISTFPDKYLVAGSGMAGIGSTNLIVTRKLTDRFYLCGDGVSEVSDVHCLFAPRVMACAAHQAHTVIRILVGEEV